jgi:predicted permease
LRSRHEAELVDVFAETRNELGRRPGITCLLRFYAGITADVLRRRFERKKQTRRAAARSGLRIALPRWLFELRQDTVYGIRSLTRSKTFTVIAVLSLALGIGVNTGMFTFVNTTLKPVPGVNHAERVVEVLGTSQGREMEVWAYPDFKDVRETTVPIELAGWKMRDGSLTTGQGGERVRVMYVSASYLHVLGVVPARGRDFLASEDVSPGQHPVAIVSHAMWQNRLDGNSDIIGSTITLNQTPYTVIGVAPEEFTGHRPLQAGMDLWVPLMQDRWVAGKNGMADNRDSRWLRVLGRLREGATIDDANAALQTVFTRLEQQYPESNEDRGARAHPFKSIQAMGRAQSMMAVYGLFVLLGVVLLIICGNVTGMVLARSATREREISLRLALGSGRGRLVRLLMVEALLLALVGAALGVVFAYWGSLALMTIAPPLPDGSFLDVRPNGAILGYTLTMALAATLAVGLIPAIRFSRPELVSSLKDDTGVGGRRVGRIHRIAASAQTGVALILLVLCTLSLRAVGTMGRRDLGFEPHNLLVARIDLGQTGDEAVEDASVFLNRMNESVGSLPGVDSWTVADGIPLDLVGNFTSVSRADRPDETAGRVTVEFTLATEGFFETVGTPILRGRGFQITDDATSEPVVVITQGLGERMWPGEEALGKHLRLSIRTRESREYSVIGVVGHVSSSRATEDWPQVFVPLWQTFHQRIMVAVRATTDALALVRPFQSAIMAAEPSLPIPTITTSESLVTRSTEGQRMTAQMGAWFGLLALLLSAIGVYGVVAFAVTNRTREIGVRMALGATREGVLRTVLGDALRLAVPGLVIGGILAVGTGFAIRSTLLGVSPMDPISFGIVIGILVLVVLLASIVPAKRASGTNPMEALRCE